MATEGMSEPKHRSRRMVNPGVVMRRAASCGSGEFEIAWMRGDGG